MPVSNTCGQTHQNSSSVTDLRMVTVIYMDVYFSEFFDPPTMNAYPRRNEGQNHQCLDEEEGGAAPRAREQRLPPTLPLAVARCVVSGRSPSHHCYYSANHSALTPSSVLITRHTWEAELGGGDEESRVDRQFGLSSETS